jgi:hypothetical protein
MNEFYLPVKSNVLISETRCMYHQNIIISNISTIFIASIILEGIEKIK